MSDVEKYDELWDEAHRAFTDGTLRVDEPPADGAPRWGLSLVLLPPPLVSARMASTAAELGRAYVGSHHIYGASDLHLTITSLEAHRDHVDETTIEHYVDAVDRSRKLLDVRVRLTGIGGSAAGAFVQGFDDGALAPIRRQMRQAAAELHDGVAPPMAFVRDTAHVSISVHREAVAEPFAAEHIRRRRRTEFGEMTNATAALVRYRPRDQWLAMEVLHTVR